MANRLKYFIITAWLLLVGIAYCKLFPFGGIIAGLPCLSALKFSVHFVNHLLVLFLILISANGWGRMFWRNRHLLYLEKFLFATGAGLGFLSLIVLGADLIGFTNHIFYFILLLAGTVLFLLSGEKIHKNASFHVRLWLLLSLLPIASSLIGALAPPTQFDSLVYHLALPAHYLSAGKMYAVPHNFFFSFPQNMEMLFQMALALDEDVLANLLHWIFLPLTGLAILAFSHRYWKPSLGMIAGVIWMFTPAVMFLATGTYIDLALTYFVFLSLYSVILAFDSDRNYWIYAAGLFLGLALGTKYTAGAAGVVLFFIILLRDFPQVNRWKQALLFCAMALLLFSPWLFKNLLFLRNPIAPWGSRVFGSSLLDPRLASDYFTHIQHHGLPLATVKDVVYLPWKLTAFGYSFGGAFDIIGPVFLFFIPALFLLPKIDRILKVVLIFVAGFVFVWLLTGKVLRFLAPVMPFLCILSAQGFYRLTETQWMKSIAYTFLALGLMHNILLYHWTMAAVDPYSVVLGQEQRNRYLERKVNYYDAAHTALGALPSGSKVLFWGETRSYFCPHTAVVPTVFDYHPLPAWANAAAGSLDLANTLKQEKITHVFINTFELSRLGTENKFSEDGRKNWEEFKQRYMRPVFKDNYCQLYEITY